MFAAAGSVAAPSAASAVETMSDRVPPASSVLGGLAQVGKYFQVVSIVPAAVVVVPIFTLLSAGAPGQSPDWEGVSGAVGGLDLGDATVLGLAVLLVGMALHPFQFAMTQLLEGYWGPSRPGRAAAASRARVHLHLRRCYAASAEFGKEKVAAAVIVARQPRRYSEVSRLEAEALTLAIHQQAWAAAADRYPPQPHRTMPTRLGNVLRRHEDLAGEPYGLDALAVVPHLIDVAPAHQAAYIEDARTELDLAVRFVASWSLLAVASFSLLWPYGTWLAVPLIAYGLAWLSYRGAVHAAEEYGSALLVLADLNADALIDRFLIAERVRASRLDAAKRLSAVARRDDSC